VLDRRLHEVLRQGVGARRKVSIGHQRYSILV